MSSTENEIVLSSNGDTFFIAIAPLHARCICVVKSDLLKLKTVQAVRRKYLQFQMKQ